MMTYAIWFGLLQLIMVACAVLMGQCVKKVIPLKEGISGTVVYLLLYVTVDMPTWVADENPLFLFAAYMIVFMCCGKGTRRARTGAAVLFYCLLVPVGMMLDTLGLWGHMPTLFDSVGIMLKGAIWLTLYLFIRRLLSAGPVTLSDRLWGLVCLLLLAPLFGILSFSIWGIFWKETRYAYHDGIDALAYFVIPFVLFSAAAVLFAAVLLSRHEKLEEENRLAGLRDVYYRGLQREQKQVRTLRHDMRNHLITISGLLKQNDTGKALKYIEELSKSPAMKGVSKFCENETANAVLASKKEEMDRDGLAADFSISLPASLPISAPELASILGNAIDNAMEAARQAKDKRIKLRARVDKGLFMLRVVNAYEGERLRHDGGFTTTKPDKKSHGLGLQSIREIAERCGGTMEAAVYPGEFELVVCIPVI